MRTFLNLLLLTVSGSGIAFGEIKVASLHPLMADLVREVGGEHVSIVEIGKAGFNVHTFQPTAQDLQAMAKCQLIVASGKGLERYLEDLRDGVGQVEVLEVGATIPSLETTEGCNVCNHPDHAHHHHDHGPVVDPHWWHDVTNMRRAVKVVERALSELDPANQAEFAQRSRTLQQTYRQLDIWVRVELTKVPIGQRRLVTAHAAFGYFCNAYDFEASSVLGLSGDHEIPAQELLQELKTLKKEGVRTVFPETLSNPKVLREVAAEAGAEIGQALIADGGASSFEEMMRANVTAIVEGLGKES